MNASSVELDEVRAFLAANEPFSHLPDSELDALPRVMTMRFIPRGTRVVDVGDTNDTLHVIRSGAVDIISAEGVLVDRRESGLTFGYSTLVASAVGGGTGVSQYAMEVVEDALVLELPRAAFDELTARHPDVARFFSAQARRTSATVRALGDDPLRTQLADVALHPVCGVAAGTTIADAAQALTNSTAPCLLVLEEDGTIHSIVTDKDFRVRVVAAGTDVGEIVDGIGTRDVVTVAPETMAMEALLIMAERGIHHLPVVSGGVLGIVSETTITRLIHDDPVHRAATIAKARADEIHGVFTDAATLAASGSAEEAAGVMTMIADALARRLCHLAEEHLGPPPVPYAFVAVGSQGRREMGLASDQDNALVLDDAYDAALHGDYFARLGEFVCTGLDRAGQVLCPGEMMASNPQWRKPVSEWERQFHAWITAPEPDALLHTQVFFDLRTVAGDAALGQRVHSFAVRQAKGSKRLHAHLASLAARREPPLTLFRGLVVERDGDYANTLDVKKGGTAGIVQMARLYSLAAGCDDVGTVARLKAAAGSTVSTAGAAELADAFAYLRHLTHRHQVAQLKSGQRPDYHIDPNSLGRMEREHLRDAFRTIKGMQQSLATTYPVRNI